VKKVATGYFLTPTADLFQAEEVPTCFPTQKGKSCGEDGPLGETSKRTSAGKEVEVMGFQGEELEH